MLACGAGIPSAPQRTNQHNTEPRPKPKRKAAAPPPPEVRTPEFPVSGGGRRVRESPDGEGSGGGGWVRGAEVVVVVEIGRAHV